MYSPKIDENQIRRLYRLREFEKSKGKKSSIAGLVRDAIEKYLKYKEKSMDKTEDDI